jgi:hypothetical protein
MSETWDRSDAIDRLQPFLARYLRESASRLRPSSATEPVELQPADWRRLLVCHLGAMAAEDDLVGVADQLIRIMPASVGRRREEFSALVRGRVDWQNTARRRIASGDPTLFVCEPVDRRYDTNLGRLLKLALAGMSSLWRMSGFANDAGSAGDAGGESIGSRLRTVSKAAANLEQSRKLRQVRRVDRSHLRFLDETVDRYPVARPLAPFVDLYYRGLELDDRSALKELMLSAIFGPSEDSRLFELEVGMNVLRTLESQGFELLEPMAIVPGDKGPLAQLANADHVIQLWWQKSHWKVCGLDPALGLWRQVLESNSMTPSPLRPDFVVWDNSARRMVLVEVKLTAKDEDGFTLERDGIRDMLGYLADVGAAPGQSFSVQGGVVAWNATGRPATDGSPILVASQNEIGELVRSAMSHVPAEV